ncbi:hypothetical protein AJ87_34210 [Rhizobium yanglingense]|nr:hypothetical protein AJ87_34210 [Rhizobium yanglingense]
MALTDDINMLSQQPLFKGMSADQLRLVAFGADRRLISTGQMLFREGSPAESAMSSSAARWSSARQAQMAIPRSSESRARARYCPNSLW